MYPDAVTLSAGATVQDVLPWIDTDSSGCSVKDSFASLDLTASGFEVLFDASWIHRPPDRPPAASPWTPVRTPDALVAWETAWSGDEPAGLFRPELLADEAVLVAGAYEDGRIVGGAVLNGSASVVGVSNLFAADDDLDRAWGSALSSAAEYFPGLPVVGYEHGDALAAAVRNGFRDVGALRVWLRP